MMRARRSHRRDRRLGTSSSRSPSTSSCIQALEHIIAKISNEHEGAQVVYRIHGDRASELTGAKVRDHFAPQRIVVTSTPGHEPNNNGRAERGIGIIK